MNTTIDQLKHEIKHLKSELNTKEEESLKQLSQLKADNEQKI